MITSLIKIKMCQNKQIYMYVYVHAHIQSFVSDYVLVWGHLFIIDCK